MVGMGDNMDKVYEIFLVETFLKIINEVNEIIFWKIAESWKLDNSGGRYVSEIDAGLRGDQM